MSGLPVWLRKKTPKHLYTKEIKDTLGDIEVNSVCESAKCPNRGECFQKKTMTFMILGDRCTRDCNFCGVFKGEAQELDPLEPFRVAEAVEKLGIQYVVITSVTRDDLEDGGVEHYLKTVNLIKDRDAARTIEVLIPDLKGDEKLWQRLINAPIDVLNHNVETVPSLYKEIRPSAKYESSLTLLKYFKDNSNFKIKSGLMVGVGETEAEVKEVLSDLKEAGCDIVTIGQYLRPTTKQIEVKEYIAPEIFDKYTEFGKSISLNVFAGPWVRSSYQAEEVFATPKV